jgi:multiple sugar transport system permease protein
MISLRPKLVSKLSFARRDAIWGYAFIFPWIIGLIVFTAGPVLSVIYYSFTKYDIFNSPQWIGLGNYIRAISSDRMFWRSLSNTFSYVALTVPAQMLLAFVVALLLRNKFRGSGIFRAAYYVPMVVPYVAASVLWSWMLHPRLGVINHILEFIGLPAPMWLLSETWAKPAIALLAIWHIGQPMVVFLAGLQGVPEDLYEAAKIDGASMLQQTRYVTIPLMTPVILYNAIMGIINAFQVFTFAYIMTGGGPLNSTMFFSLYIYRQAFNYFDMGYASALAMVLFMLVFGMTIALFKWSSSWIHYES